MIAGDLGDSLLPERSGSAEIGKIFLPKSRGMTARLCAVTHHAKVRPNGILNNIARHFRRNKSQ